MFGYVDVLEIVPSLYPMNAITYPMLQFVKMSVVPFADSKSEITYILEDIFGKAYTGMKDVKVSIQTESGSIVDANKSVKLNKDKNAITLTVPKKEAGIGRHTVIFELQSSSFPNNYILSQSLKVVDSITVSSASYKLATTSGFPSSIDD
jgi:hypothetical protein